MPTSGSTAWSPSVAEFIRAAFARCQIFPPQITANHMFDARFATNLILSTWSANMGVNLFAVDQIVVPLQPNTALYVLPSDTVDILDAYLRSFTPNTSATRNIGNALHVIGPLGNPLVSETFGDPLIAQPPSGTLSSTAGSQVITLYWPGHGLIAGSPIFWGCPISIGGVAVSGFSVVFAVIDANTLQFLAPVPARETQAMQGATPLFSTTALSAAIDCVLPGHGQTVGSTFTVNIPTTVGGIILSGAYTVTSVSSSYEFGFAVPGAASTADSQFENGGRINVTSQSPSVQYSDVPMLPLSRTDHAALPNKYDPGRPTAFWLDRVVPPQVSVYPVPPPIVAANDVTAPGLVNPAATGVAYYGFAAYRMRQIQDAVPVGGQQPDVAPRFYAALTAALTAAMAEIYNPSAWKDKLAAAEIAWERAALADAERVTVRISPAISVYFR